MKTYLFRVAKASIAGVLVVMLAAPMAQAAALQEQRDQQQQPDANPENPTSQNTPAAPSPQLAEPATRPNNQQSDQQQNSNPVGTAAAPVAKPTGIAASRPAGAVIAPAKQRRMRAIIIRVGIVVGAGVAIGTVAALSRGSSARP